MNARNIPHAAGCVLLGLVLLTAVLTGAESRAILESSSSSASEAGTVLGFTASLPARRRSLLDRPASTCGEAAFPKDVEVEEVDTWLFSLAEFLSLPRSACTAMGLQITAGAKSFTVFCLGNSGQLAAFTAGTVAGATVSAGSTTMLSNVDIVFDSGSKVTLEANLKTQVAPGLPTAVLQCDLLAVQIAADVGPLLARRHLLGVGAPYVVPDAEDLAKITVGLDGVLDILAAASGIAREQWTAVNALIFTPPGNDKLIATVFVKATPAEGASLIANWVTISGTAGLEAFSFGTSLVSVPEGDFPSLSVSLNINLQLEASETVQQLTAVAFADVDLFDDRR
jgi:hypothetical protein